MVFDSLTELLSNLGLERYAEVFTEEAITDTSLLLSMGPEMLRENLEELGVEDADIDRFSVALFPGAGGVQVTNVVTGVGVNGKEVDCDDDDEGMVIEDNVAGPVKEDREPVPSGGDKLPMDLTQEEIDAAEAESRWLLNPLSMMDLSHTKKMLMDKMKEGISFQRSGHFANARAVYTKALSYEAPNKRMAAAFYYNRSACQRELGQLSLALRDAQLATENEPTNLRSWWRVADVAVVLGDVTSASEAIAAGLKLNPRCKTLLQLKLQVERD